MLTFFAVEYLLDLFLFAPHGTQGLVFPLTPFSLSPMIVTFRIFVFLLDSLRQRNFQSLFLSTQTLRKQIPPQTQSFRSDGWLTLTELLTVVASLHSRTYILDDYGVVFVVY